MKPISQCWSLTQDELFRQLGSSPQGLSTGEVATRLQALRRQKKVQPAWMRDAKLLLRQYGNPLVLLLHITLPSVFVLSSMHGHQGNMVVKDKLAGKAAVCQRIEKPVPPGQ